MLMQEECRLRPIWQFGFGKAVRTAGGELAPTAKAGTMVLVVRDFPAAVIGRVVQTSLSMLKIRVVPAGGVVHFASWISGAELKNLIAGEKGEKQSQRRNVQHET